ncbi:MAG TPA: TfoX/Sxy family protein [Steroidobacteraceae bacterium]|nr:TfoX/Sxy family protein [Steroidobacteraceae bacterium]
MALSSDFLAYVLEQLAALRGVSSRRMFGGAGLYREEFFFALIADDVLYLRVDDSNRGDYTSRGMAAFRPYADRPHLSMSYFEVPADVLENAVELVSWAERSVAVAMSAPARPKPGRPRARPAARARRRR